MGIPLLERCRWLLPEELPTLLGPYILTLGQSGLLLIGHGAAVCELRRQRISGSLNRRRGSYLIFVATKPDCTRGNDQDNQHHRCNGG